MAGKFAPYIEGMGSVTYTFGDFNAVLGSKHARRYFVNEAGERLTFGDENSAREAVLKATGKHPARSDAFGVARVRS